jgi:hypothetical protein
VPPADESDNDPEKAEFWNMLGGFGPVKSAEDGGSDEAPAASAKKLFRLSDASGTMTFTEVASGAVHKRLLDSKDVFVFDTGAELFVWIGTGASPAEKAKGMGYASDYVTKFNRPPYMPVTRIYEGGENEVFNASFD